MEKRNKLVAVALALLMVASVSAIAIMSQAQGSSQTVTIQNFSFNPSNLTITSGTTVTWTNKDNVDHTVTSTSGPESFDSNNIAPGGTFSHTFNTAGSYSYYCKIHPYMTAGVTVTGSSQGGGQGGGNQTGGGNPSTGAAAPTGQLSGPGAPPLVNGSISGVTGPTPGVNDWPMINADNNMSRSSEQTVIGKDNVGQLQPKWILNTGTAIENPPLIIGNTGYLQNNRNIVIAFDMDTGFTKWTYDPNITAVGGSRTEANATFSHGMAYENGVIYAPLGAKQTYVALNANNGSVIWESPYIHTALNFNEPAPPVIWKNILIAGSAGGDLPPLIPPVKGFVTGIDKTNGKILWTLNTTMGDWVAGANGTVNGGATVWSGGSVDTDKGIFYAPTGNPGPDFNASSRPQPNPMAESIIAVNMTDGKLLWNVTTLQEGAVLTNLNASQPDVHDWDSAWGTNLVSVNMGNGSEKVVIAHTKRGDVMALNATNGKLLWSNTLGYIANQTAVTTANGSGVVWPGPGNGVEAYSAFDKNDTVYVAVTSQPTEYFLIPGDKFGDGFVKLRQDAIANKIGNGTLVALDMRTGKIKWSTDVGFPMWVSPLVTNGVVFTGHTTSPGDAITESPFGGVIKSTQVPTGFIQGYDKDTGKLLWEANVGAPVGIGGPSIGHGTLLVPTGSPAPVPGNTGGYLIAYGLPSSAAASNSTASSSTASSTMAPTPSATPSTSCP